MNVVRNIVNIKVENEHYYTFFSSTISRSKETETKYKEDYERASYELNVIRERFDKAQLELQKIRNEKDKATADVDRYG